MKKSGQISFLQRFREPRVNPILLNFILIIRENRNAVVLTRMGKKVCCKHMVAAYFTALPAEADKFYTEAMAYQEEEESRQEELEDKVCHYIWHMKKSELQQALLQLLFDGPDWQYDRFISENGLEDDW